MNIKKRITAVLTAMTLCLSLAACGGNGADSANAGKGQTAGEKVAAAIEKFNAAKSCSVSMQQDIAMEMKGGVEDQNIAYTIGMNMDMFQKPIKAKGKVTIDMGELGGKQEMELYMQEVDKQAEIYIGMNGQWVKQAADTEGMEMYDLQRSMDLYLDSASDFQEAGPEQLNGVDAVKFTGVIKGDNLEKVMQEGGMMDMVEQFGAAGVEEDQIKKMISGLGDLPMSVWINADGYPVQYEMDMTPMMSSIMDNAMKIASAAEQGISVKISKAKMTMSVSNFDSVADFELPAEAQNAIDMAA